mgnify:CR=1 FL=1
MEPLPTGANFKRAKILWELGLHIAGNPDTPYGGNRDMNVVVGSGSGEEFRPWLQMASGSAIMAVGVAKGQVSAAFVNPSAMLTQAYRGTGLFHAPLPVRIVAMYPSYDRFVFMLNPKTGLKSLKDVKDRKYPLYVSVKEDVTHSTRVFIDQALSYYGFSLADIISWGGRLNLTGAPNDKRRMDALADGSLEAPGRVSVLHNGVAIHSDTVIKGDTFFNAPPSYTAHPDALPIRLQDHGDPVQFRSIWIRPFEPEKPTPVTP